MIDLHTHSTNSDGSESATGVVEQAFANGSGQLRALALTDHDTMAGHAEAKAACDRLGITFVPGCEISAQLDTGKSAHILVYFVEEDSAISEMLAVLRNDRDTRNERLVAKLHELGYPVQWERIIAAAGNPEVVGRPHFAEEIERIDGGREFPSRQAIFDDLLGNDGRAYIPKAKISPREVVEAARETNSLVVLAHPYVYGLPDEERERQIRLMAEIGAHGVETYYSRNFPEQTERLLELCDELGLVPTGGSDFHGTMKPDLRVVTGMEERPLSVPDSVLDRLLELRA